MATYQLWPDTAPSGTSAGAQSPYTLGTQFYVTQACTLARVRWWSPPGATALPSICGVWDIAAQAAVAEDAAPAWQLSPGGGNASAGAGWVYCDLTAAGVTLQPGVNYAASVFQPAASVPWWATQAGYWTGGGGLGGASGRQSGPLAAPNTNTSVNGQGCYDTSGTWAFPGSNPGNGEVHYVDVEVVPLMPVISAVGAAYSANGSALKTLTVNPAAVGNLLVFGYDAGATAASSSVSGGGVATWKSAAQYYDSVNSVIDEIWWGVVTATGSATITVTNPGATGWGRLWAREFTSAPAATWALLAASPASPGSGGATAAGTTVTYPALSGFPGLYVGGGVSVFGTMSGGSSTGYTYDNIDTHFEVAWNPSAPSSPTSAQTNTGGYEAVGALFGFASGGAGLTVACFP